MKDRKTNPILLVMAVWICVLATLLSWLVMENKRNEKALALTTANAFYQQVVLSRRWNASHGGVYVPVTSTTQPNQYLPRQNRDLSADNGLKLTKVNPSYMTRQLAELAQKNAGGIHFHITSLKPIRPENKATEWEARWLKSFEQGVMEQGEFFEEGQATWFRYMAPLLTGPECLQCHAQQGYKEGDIRGGLSISLPYPRHNHLSLLLGYGSASAISLLIIFICGTLYERKRLLFDATFNSPLPACITNKNHTILQANESYWTTFGLPPGHKKTLKCYEHRPGKSCHTEFCPLTKIMQGAGNYACETSKEKEGATRYFIVTAKPLNDAKGKVVGIVESFQEITALKRAEEALEESNSKLESLSITDGLTGIANRRRFDEVLEHEHARHARSRAELSLIMLDLDHFKMFNDCYGHLKGDECLRKVAQVMAECAARPADLAARYGGEEFVCILPETDSSGAVAIAEKIRQDIIARAIPHQESPVAEYVTASLGVATVQCTPADAAVDIVALADGQLYLAKSAGRNRVKFVATSTAGGRSTEKLVQLTWKASLACGHPLIDAQHQGLMRTANGLLEAVLSTRPAPEISILIAKLLDDARQHFHDEEKILASIAFPDLSQHAAEHAKLLAKGLELAAQFQASTLTVGDVFEFLASEVIMRHMLEADREFLPFLDRQVTADLSEGALDDEERKTPQQSETGESS
ncbi:MAG: diguanylate cyclase [Desulfobulbaceae bacterium]|nr:diguanylate cyclase [Desulfobulbaceae bacterium]